MSYITYGKWRKDVDTGIQERNVYRVHKFMGMFEIKHKIARETRKKIEKNRPREVWANIYFSFMRLEPCYWIGGCYESEDQAIDNIDGIGQQYIKTIKIEI